VVSLVPRSTTGYESVIPPGSVYSHRLDWWLLARELTGSSTGRRGRRRSREASWLVPGLRLNPISRKQKKNKLRVFAPLREKHLKSRRIIEGVQVRFSSRVGAALTASLPRRASARPSASITGLEG
jgi:hypothetical protein